MSNKLIKDIENIQSIYNPVGSLRYDQSEVNKQTEQLRNAIDGYLEIHDYLLMKNDTVLLAAVKTSIEESTGLSWNKIKEIRRKG